MEPAVEKRFQRIEGILHAMAERENQMELRSIKRFELAGRRMDRAEQVSQQRHAEAMERMGTFDKKLEATRRLVEGGIRFVTRLAVENRQLSREVRQLGLEVREVSREVREVSRIQKAMLRTYGNGKNGHN